VIVFDVWLSEETFDVFLFEFFEPFFGSFQECELLRKTPLGVRLRKAAFDHIFDLSPT